MHRSATGEAAAGRPRRAGRGADEESRERLAAVARMYYLDDLGQQAIAGIMGISRSQVSRLLTRARERGIVRITVEDHDPRDRLLERRLSERYGLRLAVVVRCAERAPEPLRRSIGYVAAPAVADLIGAGDGARPGRRAHPGRPGRVPAPARRRAGGITAVQLMGNIGPLASPIDAVDLSRAVAQRFGGDSYTISAPAIAQDRSARDLFLAHEHIRMVRDLFGGLSLALVGIGSLDDSAFIERGVLDPAPLARLREAGAVGEVCGRFFDARGRECPTDYGERVISIDLESLRRCPDVVAVTNGPRRAAALRAALAGGLVSSLVIDDAGARALLRRARRGRPGARRRAGRTPEARGEGAGDGRPPRGRRRRRERHAAGAARGRRDRATWAPCGATCSATGRRASWPTSRPTPSPAGPRSGRCAPPALAVRPAHVFPAAPRLHADWAHATALADALRGHAAVPLAVGAGTVNDLTKLGAHLAGRPALVVATAASMDGYAAYGAAITRDGFKQTIACPAPLAVVGDLDRAGRGPESDDRLRLRRPGGQDPGRGGLAGRRRPGRRAGRPGHLGPRSSRRCGTPSTGPRPWRPATPAAVAALFRCLVMSGLAMQAARSSRPASGAEHQLSHLWEMRGLAVRGEEVSHGFKVAVGSVLTTGLYERLLAADLEALDPVARGRAWPALDATLAAARRAHAGAAPALLDQVLAEVRAKRLDGTALRDRLERLLAVWPALRRRLERQLIPAAELARRLRLAGCPVTPEEIGVRPEDVAADLAAAGQIRRRYTVLDLAAETGQLAAPVAPAGARRSGAGRARREDEEPMAVTNAGRDAAREEAQAADVRRAGGRAAGSSAPGSPATPPCGASGLPWSSSTTSPRAPAPAPPG